MFIYCLLVYLVASKCVYICTFELGSFWMNSVYIQYALSGSGGRALQMDLNRIAETADTSTNKGLGYVLTGKLIICFRSHFLLICFNSPRSD